MIPFDIRRAKAGQTVVTRDGREVKIINFNDSRNVDYPIAAIISASGDYTIPHRLTFTRDGKFTNTRGYDDIDLCMKYKQPSKHNTKFKCIRSINE